MKTSTTVSCGKCDGKGYIKEYGHVANGVCFACDGKGITTRSGKRVELKIKHVVAYLPLTTKYETFYLLDMIERDAITIVTCFDHELENLTELGYLTVDIKGNRRTYSPVNYKSEVGFNTLVDWSK